MTNLIERLEGHDPCCGEIGDVYEAVDELERFEEDNKRLRGYLRECGNKFASYGDHIMQAGCYDLALREDES
jgi:hypothetical protein